MSLQQSLQQSLEALGLRYAAEHLDDIIAHAARHKMSPRQLLEYLAHSETEARKSRGLARRLDRSRLGRFKPMADYDWNHPTRIDREEAEVALCAEFVEQAGNVIIVAANGLGKTMLAKNIAHQALTIGHSVLFVTAAQMLLDLSGQESARALEHRLRYYQRPRLLCIDEIGYLSFDNRNADLLFEVVRRRYEHKSIVLTTNLDFSQWQTVFPSAAAAVALIDRLIHHASIVSIEGESYRKREAEARTTPRRKK